jgi:hypothetical protein
VLLVIAVLCDGRPGVAAGGALLGALYAAGPRTPSWLWLVTAGWAGLAVASAEFGWLVFPLFFVYLYVLPLWAAGFGMVVLAAASVVVAGWHAGGLSLPLILAPILAVAVALTWRVLLGPGGARLSGPETSGGDDGEAGQRVVEHGH